MSHEMLKVIGPGQIATWDHEVNLVVYITALSSTFAIPRFLFTIYLIVTDTQPLFLIEDLDYLSWPLQNLMLSCHNQLQLRQGK